MVQHSRHDFVELTFIYTCLFISFIFLALIRTENAKVVLGLNEFKSKNEEIKSLYSETKEFENINILAKAYVVYDIVDKKIISSRNPDLILPLASLTKIMTGITALKHNKINTKITITPSDIKGGYDLGLKNNQIWELGELLKYTLIFSSNDGAQAIADKFGGTEYFVRLMNIEANLLGLRLHFNNPSGLDVGTLIGGEGSATDVAKLLSVARNLFPEILDTTTKMRANVMTSTGKLTGIPNTNQDVVNLLGMELSKTGYTDNAGGNLAVVVDITIGHPVAIVVLGSTKNGRFSDVETLYKALLSSLNK